jgi:hypothetical protein
MHFKAVSFKEINYILTTFNRSKLAHNTNGTITVRGNTNVKITIEGFCRQVQQQIIYMETCSDCVLTGRQVISEKKTKFFVQLHIYYTPSSYMLEYVT